MIQGQLADVLISVGGLVFVFFGLYTMNKGRKERAQSERIADTETTPVREREPGPGQEKRTAHPAEDATPLDPPITDGEAVATYVETEEWESSGQGGGNWQTKHESKAAVPMVVDDGTGEVRVELPADGELNVEETEWTVGSGDEPPEEIRRYLEDEGDLEEPSRYDVGPVSIGERRRYSEGLIEPSEEVYVLGAARERGSEWGERDYAIEEPTDAGDFILSDKSEGELVREGKRGGLVSLGFGAVLVVVGGIVAVAPWVGA
jgi:hypothetical protein